MTALGLVGCERSGSDQLEVTSPTILPVRVSHVRQLDEFSIPITFYGRINATKESALSFELAGRLETILVDEGDSIQNSQLLATLNTDILAARRRLLVAKKEVEEAILRRLRTGERPEVIAAATAAVERLTIEVKRASINERREQKLLESKSISKSRYDQLMYDHEALKLALKEKQARLQELISGTREDDIDSQEKRVLMEDAEISVLDAQLKKAELVAPFDGEVIRRLIDDGTVADAGQPVLVVVESSQREARFSLPANSLAEAKETQSIAVGKREFPVTDVRVVSKVDGATRTIDVVFTLENSGELLAGESCRLLVKKTVAQECFELPVNALVPSIRGLWSCFRIEESANDGFRVDKVEITVEYTDGDRIFATGSLSENDPIVVEGVQKLVPGMRVKPLGDAP